MRVIMPLVGLGISLVVGMTLPDRGAGSIVALLVVLAGVAASIRWPTFGILAIVIMTSTVFAYGALPRLGSAGFALYAPEVLLLLLLVRASVARRTSDPAHGSMTCLGWAVGGLVASTVLSLTWAGLIGESLRDSITFARFMSMYGAYFVGKSILVDAPTYRRLVIGLIMIGIPTALVYDLAVLTDLKEVLSRTPLLSIDVYDLYVSPSAQPIQQGRVFMPGRALVQFLTPAVLVAAITFPKGRARLGMQVLSALFGVTIVLIYTRTVWVTTLVTIGLLFITGTRQQRASLGRLTAFCTSILIVIGFATALAPGASGPSALDNIVQRLLTVFTDNVDDPDLQARIVEAGAVLARVNQNLPFGTAFFSPDGVVAWHDGYLALLLNVGLVGLSCFSLFAIVCVRNWWRIRLAESTDSFVWCFAVGFGLSLLRILLNGFTESTFVDSDTVPLLALGSALVEQGIAISLPGQQKSTVGRVNVDVNISDVLPVRSPYVTT